MNWPRSLKIKVKEPLKDRTTFKIGGAAQFFSEPKDYRQLNSLLTFAKKNKLPVFIIGAGSNLLISDKGVRGLVIKLSPAYFKKISLKKSCIEAGSAVKLSQLIGFCEGKSLKGLEFLIGIPGTLGGALAMNAGCWGKSIGDLVKEVKVMDYNGKIKKISSKDIKFSYRKSNLAKYVILSAILRFEKYKQAEIKRNIRQYLTLRRNTQGLTYPNAGCIFKNPRNNHSAGKLIDLCGLKGKRIGNAFVSGRHANFILNKGNAAAKDVLGLMHLIKRQVKDKFRLNLEPEIKIWA